MKMLEIFDNYAISIGRKSFFFCAHDNVIFYWNERVNFSETLKRYIFESLFEILGLISWAINPLSLNKKWDNVFKNGPSKICRRQPLKKFTCSILEYFVPNYGFRFYVIAEGIFTKPYQDFFCLFLKIKILLIFCLG